MNQQIKQRIEQINNGQVPEGYKKTEFGVFPCDWVTDKTLNKVCIINPKTEELPEEFIYVDLESVIDRKIIERKIVKKENAPSRAQRVLSLNDIILQVVRPYQKNNLFFKAEDENYKTVASTGYALLRSEMQPFLFQLLHSDYFVNQVNVKCTGTNYPAINGDDLGKVYVAYPTSSAEQEKIGEILMKWDKAIELYNQQIEKLTLLKSSCIKKMFPQEGKKVPEWRFKGFSNAWEQRKLGEIVSLRGRIGFRGYTQADLVDAGEGAITFSPADINDAGYISLTDNKYISWTKYEESPEIKVQVGDILFTKTASIGKVGFVRELKEKATINPQFALLTPNGKTDGYFTFLSIRTDEFMKKVRDITGGSSVPTMSQEKLKELTFMAPSLSEQKNIGEFFSNLDNLITLHQRKVEIIIKQRKALQQYLLNGIVRV